MNNYYFTFGFGQKYQNGFYIIESENSLKAREEMNEKFGKQWSMQYTEKQWFNKDGISQQEEYKLHMVK